MTDLAITSRTIRSTALEDSDSAGFTSRHETQNRPYDGGAINFQPSSEQVQYSVDISESHDVYPDGGREAWLCVFGSFLFLFPSYGFMQSIGTVQSYLERNQLSSYSSRDIGWIPGIFTFFGLLFGIQVGPIFDRFGPRVLGIVGTVVYIPMFFLLAQCQLYWQFILCLGLLGGLGASITSTLAMSIVSNWFMRRRGLATGIAMCGSSFGGVVMPIMLRHIFERWGWQWSMRTVGFIAAGALGIGNLCIRPNPHLNKRTNLVGANMGSPSEQPARRSKASLDLSAFTSFPFTLITVTILALEFVIFGATGLLPIYAIKAGFPADTGFYIIAILNAASILGRSLPGLAGDYLGPFNVLSIMISFTLFASATVWVPFGAESLAALYIFSALWGFGTGSFLSITPVCMGKTCHTKDYGRYFGTMYFVVSFSLLITIPLGGQILESLGTRTFAGVYVSILGFGGLSFLLSRWAILGKRWIFWIKI